VYPTGERISFGVTLMLALTVFMLIVAEMIPASSETVPMIAIFFTSVMVQMVLMVFAMSCTLNLHLREPSEYNRIGKWTRRVIYNRLAFCFGLRKDAKFSFSADIKTMIKRVKEWANTYSIRNSTSIDNIFNEMDGHVNGENISIPECDQVNSSTLNQYNSNDPDNEENSLTNRLLKKSIQMTEDKLKEEEFLSTVKDEFVVCANTFDSVAQIFFTILFFSILFIYLTNTKAC